MSDPVIPADLPLPLPLPEGVLAVLLVLLFVIHIAFVNLMLGGSLIALVCELLGLRDERYDRLAHQIAKTITVTKSLAVVLGVGPLLAINLLYTVPFYSANRATGSLWMLVVPLTALAFLLTYAHKYSWEALRRHKALHIAIGAGAAGLLLVIPLIFLVQVVLMLHPEHWATIQDRGMLHALLLDSLIPRWLHVVLSAVAATGLFLVWWLTRPRFDLAAHLPGETRAGLRRRFYTIALVASAAQFLIGPLVLMTLPSRGISGMMLLHIGLGVACAAVALGWLWREIRRADSDMADPVRADGPLGRRFWGIAALLGLTVVMMATGRQLYRAEMLRPFNAQVAQRTAEKQALSAHYRAHPAPAAEEDPLATIPGYGAFQKSCMSCHAIDSPLVGPSVVEMHRLYGDDEAALVAWVRTVQNPKAVRPGSPPMPAFGPGQIDDATLKAIAGFIRQAGTP
jgi:cytochrome c